MYTYKYIPQKYLQKYIHVNTYSNTNNYVHLYVQLWTRNYNMCKYVNDKNKADRRPGQPGPVVSKANGGLSGFGVSMS